MYSANEQSSVDESFSRGLLEYPQYTRPDVFMDMEVPPCFLSGNHGGDQEMEEKGSPKETSF